MLEVTENGQLTEQQLAEVEAQLNVQLPPSYRRWLQRTGGGPTMDHYELPSVDGGVGIFAGLGERYSLAEQYFGFDEALPRDLIRIAHGAGGTIALKVRGDDVGSVWWSDHDKADELGAEEPSYDYVTRLADDFDTFLASFD